MIHHRRAVVNGIGAAVAAGRFSRVQRPEEGLEVEVAQREVDEVAELPLHPGLVLAEPRLFKINNLQLAGKGCGWRHFSACRPARYFINISRV